jgi:DNA-binding CsgD family transcriptional regulator
MQGLTNKEIGQRMNISPNTVKAFLKLIMMKMGVSTRSGIIGKTVVPVMRSSSPLVAVANHPFGE